MGKEKRKIVCLKRGELRAVQAILICCAAYVLGACMGHLHAKGIETSTKCSDCPKIAITFDDGPNNDYTHKLLEGLKKRGIKATFFVLGKEVEKYPDILAEIKEDGHLIGVHSYEHVNFKQIGDEAALDQIEKTQDAIYAVTGEYADFIRPPYGCWNDSLEEKTMMIEVLWDVDPLDWATTNADIVVQRILKNAKDGSSIVLHDASESSVQAAFTVIDTLTKQGFEFVTVDELLLF